MTARLENPGSAPPWNFKGKISKTKFRPNSCCAISLRQASEFKRSLNCEASAAPCAESGLLQMKFKNVLHAGVFSRHRAQKQVVPLFVIATDRRRRIVDIGSRSF